VSGSPENSSAVNITFKCDWIPEVVIRVVGVAITCSVVDSRVARVHIWNIWTVHIAVERQRIPYLNCSAVDLAD